MAKSQADIEYDLITTPTPKTRKIKLFSRGGGYCLFPGKEFASHDDIRIALNTILNLPDETIGLVKFCQAHGCEIHERVGTQTIISKFE